MGERIRKGLLLRVVGEAKQLLEDRWCAVRLRGYHSHGELTLWGSPTCSHTCDRLAHSRCTSFCPLPEWPLSFNSLPWMWFGHLKACFKCNHMCPIKFVNLPLPINQKLFTKTIACSEYLLSRNFSHLINIQTFYMYPNILNYDFSCFYCLEYLIVLCNSFLPMVYIPFWR